MKFLVKNKGLILFYLIIFISALFLVNDVKNEEFKEKIESNYSYNFSK